MMNSPFANGKASLKKRVAIVPFRKENFEITREVYVCDTTGVEFTTEDQDYEALQKVYDLYRQKHHLQTSDEIQDLRMKYGISSTKMSLILGIGTNQYHNYEVGEMPSISNGRLIMAAMDKNMFLKFLEASKECLSKKEYLKIKNKILSVRSEAAEEEVDYNSD